MANFVELSIDRTSFVLSPLLIASDRSTDLVLTSYTEPSLVPAVTYAPSSAYQHGETALAWKYAQTGPAFTVGPSDASSEQAARTAITELAEALARLDYALTETIDDTVRTWQCLPGSVVPTGSRTYADLRRLRPTWQVTIPAYPIAS